jgi:hypothetical protein
MSTPPQTTSAVSPVIRELIGLVESKALKRGTFRLADFLPLPFGADTLKTHDGVTG